MIRHLFKMLWNRRKSNFLLMLELFFSFLVLMVVINLVITIVGEYLKSSGYAHQIDKVMLYEVAWENVSDSEAQEVLLRVKKQIQAMPGVAEVSVTRNAIPYVDRFVQRTKISYKQQEYKVQTWSVDDNFSKLLQVPVQAGRWFSAHDNASTRLPVVINRDMQKEVFGDQNPVGQLIRIDEQERVVIGVVANSYTGLLAKPMSGYFERSNLEDPAALPAGNFLIKFKTGIDIGIYTQLEKFLKKAGLGSDWSNPQMGPLAIFRSYWFRELAIPIILISVVAGFLFINVIVGLYGVFWQNISRRRSEIGIRRAVGAKSGEIYRQILGEVLVLATLAMIPGFILGTQFLIFDTFNFIAPQTYVFVMLLSASVIYVLVTLCALYPGWIASRIQPAEALHDE